MKTQLLPTDPFRARGLLWRGEGLGRRQEAPRAFTLIELLAILTVVALAGCILATASAKTGANGSAVQCLNNLRQLGKAWVMYADDNNGRLVYNHDGGNAGKGPGNEAWVGGWLDYTTSPDNTNTDLLVNHDLYPYGAFLGPYAKSPRVFKCPADRSTVTIAGRSLARVRSVSMNGRVGEGGRSWMSPSAFLLYTRLARIYRPAPAQLFVFLDEFESSINDGSFQVDPDTPWQLVDWPASHHNSGGAFAFADSHAEIRLWHDPRSMPLLVPGQGIALNVNLPGNVDVQWLQQHAAARP